MSGLFDGGREKIESNDSSDEVNLMTFRELPVGPLSRGNQPAPRSGHRIFTDDQFLYVIGGFDRTVNRPDGKIYREVWRYSLFTHEWSRMDVQGDFPSALASFALSQSSPYSNHVILFGGTAVPFGTSTSSSVHLLSFDDDSNSVHSTRIPVEGVKLGTYGHAMLRGSDPNTFYVIGGTTGHNFFLDVDKLTCKNGMWNWSNEAVAAPNMEGRYRFEAVLNEDLIYLFGGGRPDHVTEFRTLTVFDTKKKAFMEINTYPDESIKNEDLEDGYPKGRRCHSVTRWKRNVIIVGGCSADNTDVDIRYVDMYGDVWSFNLDSHQWKKMAFELTTPLFFHDATITREGCLLVWGGVLDRFSTMRTNSGQYCYLEPPSLRTLAAHALRPYIDYRSTDEANQLRISRVTNLVHEICNHVPATRRSIQCQTIQDLIAHIEFTHIPPLEDEYRQKASQAQCCPEENRASATPNMPLSCVYRLYRVAQNPQPCAPDVVRITFNHYRKRQLDPNGTPAVPNIAAATPKKEEPASVDSYGEDLSECGPNDQEDRYCCAVSECQKRFRTGAGLRLHSRTAHGVILQENTLSNQPVGNGSGNRPSSQSEQLPLTVSPTKYAASRPYKCHQCSKRYKTTAGLSNHVDQSHRKQSGGCGTPSSTDSAPPSPSPAVLDQLISQARAHGQATAAAQEQQRLQQRPLPVQVASSNTHQYGQVTSQPPLPVRSLSSTHQRYSHGSIATQQNSQILQQKHLQPRRSQFGSHQLAQVTPSNSAQQFLHSVSIFFFSKKMDEDGGASSDIMCFTPLGSGQEVGRSCHLLHFKGKKILLDCGVHPGMHGVDALPFVDFIDIEEIDLLLITHFHLDHCGALPWLLEKNWIPREVLHDSRD
ncbi:hypothetical protein KIN20_017537 [Parelaphostrongylus tenuis]|uniref:Kelch domain-containing protein 10 n=1 Tax=Parelaphostrongylus tenuis TaxID=148309 RepID=A0AAD5MI21_PARTN|nr:hypothetical protein KIN20_017537 [Parelaphostrongylus tenuis]